MNPFLYPLLSKDPPSLNPSAAPVRTRKPILNPWDKFNKPQFDEFIDNITGALEKALAHEHDYVPRRKPAPRFWARIVRNKSHSDEDEDEVEQVPANEAPTSPAQALASDEDVEDSLSEIAARRAKGKARDPREGPGLGGVNQPIELLSDDDEPEVDDDGSNYQRNPANSDDDEHQISGDESGSNEATDEDEAAHQHGSDGEVTAADTEEDDYDYRQYTQDDDDPEVQEQDYTSRNRQAEEIFDEDSSEDELDRPGPSKLTSNHPLFDEEDEEDPNVEEENERFEFDDTEDLQRRYEHEWDEGPINDPEQIYNFIEEQRQKAAASQRERPPSVELVRAPGDDPSELEDFFPSPSEDEAQLADPWEAPKTYAEDLYVGGDDYDPGSSSPSNISPEPNGRRRLTEVRLDEGSEIEELYERFEYRPSFAPVPQRWPILGIHGYPGGPTRDPRLRNGRPGDPRIRISRPDEPADEPPLPPSSPFDESRERVRQMCVPVPGADTQTPIIRDYEEDSRPLPPSSPIKEAPEQTPAIPVFAFRPAILKPPFKRGIYVEDERPLPPSSPIQESADEVTTRTEELGEAKRGGWRDWVPSSDFDAAEGVERDDRVEVVDVDEDDEGEGEEGEEEVGPIPLGTSDLVMDGWDGTEEHGADYDEAGDDHEHTGPILLAPSGLVTDGWASQVDEFEVTSPTLGQDDSVAFVADLLDGARELPLWETSFEADVEVDVLKAELLEGPSIENSTDVPSHTERDVTGTDVSSVDPHNVEENVVQESKEIDIQHGEVPNEVLPSDIQVMSDSPETTAPADVQNEPHPDSWLPQYQSRPDESAQAIPMPISADPSVPEPVGVPGTPLPFQRSALRADTSFSGLLRPSRSISEIGSGLFTPKEDGEDSEEGGVEGVEQEEEEEMHVSLRPPSDEFTEFLDRLGDSPDAMAGDTGEKTELELEVPVLESGGDTVGELHVGRTEGDDSVAGQQVNIGEPPEVLSLLDDAAALAKDCNDPSKVGQGASSPTDEAVVDPETEQDPFKLMGTDSKVAPGAVRETEEEGEGDEGGEDSDEPSQDGSDRGEEAEADSSLNPKNPNRMHPISSPNATVGSVSDEARAATLSDSDSRPAKPALRSSKRKRSPSPAPPTRPMTRSRAALPPSRAKQHDSDSDDSASRLAVSHLVKGLTPMSRSSSVVSAETSNDGSSALSSPTTMQPPSTVPLTPAAPLRHEHGANRQTFKPPNRLLQLQPQHQPEPEPKDESEPLTKSTPLLEESKSQSQPEIKAQSLPAAPEPSSAAVTETAPPPSQAGSSSADHASPTTSPRKRAILPTAAGLVTRSQCRFHKISLPRRGHASRAYFVVPGCSMTERKAMTEEDIRDHGFATEEDSRFMVADIESFLDSDLIRIVRKLVGVDLLREHEVFYLLASKERRGRKGRKSQAVATEGELPARMVSSRDTVRPSSSRGAAQTSGAIGKFRSSVSVSTRAPTSAAGSASSASISAVFRQLTHDPSELFSVGSLSGDDASDPDQKPARKAKRRKGPGSIDSQRTVPIEDVNDAKSTTLTKETTASNGVNVDAAPTIPPVSPKAKRRSKRLGKDASEYKPTASDAADSDDEEKLAATKKRASKRSTKASLKRTRTAEDDVEAANTKNGKKLRRGESI